MLQWVLAVSSRSREDAVAATSVAAVEAVADAAVADAFVVFSE
jgi:hypothetical protein